MMKIYLAGPLFSEAERAWHRKAKSGMGAVAEKLETPWEVIWPYERMTREEIEI